MSTKIMILWMIDDMLILVYQRALLSPQRIVFNPLQGASTLLTMLNVPQEEFAIVQSLCRALISNNPGIKIREHPG